VRSDSHCQRFLLSKKFFFIISAAGARSQSVLDHKRADPSPHGEVDEEDLVATCQFAPAIPLYTSTARYSRLPRIETKAVLREHGKCKLSCVVPLDVLPSSNNTCVLFLENS